VAPAFSVIVLTYNGRRWLPGCLTALAAQAGAPPFETIVFDNASTDDSFAFVRSAYPDVRPVRVEANLGFAGGNNAASREARGEWLVFLNNDTIPDAGWLAALRAEAEAHRGFALVTSRLVFMDDPSRVDSAGDGYLRAGGAFKHGHGARAADHDVSRETFAACGGAFMIRRDVFDALGGFDERFFLIYEDVDLSYRARLAGHRTWYAASAIVRHAVSASLGIATPQSVYHGQRNLEWTWLKNTPPGLLRATLLSHVVYSMAGVLHYIRIGRGGAALKGKWDAFRALPAVLADRRRIQAARAAGRAEIEPLLEQGWLDLKRREKQFDNLRKPSQETRRSGA
jgi:GT2 family glycosyltransferase